MCQGSARTGDIVSGDFPALGARNPILGHQNSHLGTPKFPCVALGGCSLQPRSLSHLWVRLGTSGTVLGCSGSPWECRCHRELLPLPGGIVPGLPCYKYPLIKGERSGRPNPLINLD